MWSGSGVGPLYIAAAGGYALLEGHGRDMSEAAKVGIAEGSERVAARAERPQLQLVRKVEVDRSRDALLTDFGKTTLEDRYLLPGESYQDMFARVATAFADDADHAQC